MWVPQGAPHFLKGRRVIKWGNTLQYCLSTLILYQIPNLLWCENLMRWYHWLLILTWGSDRIFVIARCGFCIGGIRKDTIRRIRKVDNGTSRFLLKTLTIQAMIWIWMTMTASFWCGLMYKWPTLTTGFPGLDAVNYLD